MTDQIIPLKRKWQLWFDSPSFHATYADSIDPIAWKRNIESICSFNDIKAFWNTYNYIEEPTGLCYKCSYYLFEDIVEPHYMDICNEGGITIHFIFDEENANNGWLYTILSMISENTRYADEVNGVSVKKHKSWYEVTVWLAVADQNRVDYYISFLTKLYSDKGIALQNHYTLTTDQKVCYDE